MTHHIKCVDGSIITIRTKAYHNCTARTEPEDWHKCSLVDTVHERNVPRQWVEELIDFHGGEA